MSKKHRLWILTIVLFHCSQQISSEDDSDKTKREVWSGGSFNSFNSDNNNKNDKSNFGPMSPFAHVFSAIDSLGFKLNGNVKTTVEFWPPDMDRDKFYKQRQEDSAFPLTSWFNFKPLAKEITKEPEMSYPIFVNDDNSHDYAESTVKQLNNDNNYSTKSLKEYTTKPDVIRNPQKYFKHEHYTVKPEIHDIEYDQKYILSTAKPEVIDNGHNYDIKYYKSTIKRPEVIGYKPEVVYANSYVKSTVKPFISSVEYENAEPSSSPAPLNDHSEPTVIFDDSMTNVGPVIFPSFGLTEKRTHEFITYVPTTATSPRANKKRKLKKKVKTSAITQFSKEKHIVQTPPTAAFDVIVETSSQYTPVKEIIDNDSIHYTDIISNLSNLTELSFSSYNSTGNNHHFMQQSDHHQKSIKNIIYSSKVNHSTTPYTFLIKVEPDNAAETQDEMIDDKNIIKITSSTTEIPAVSLSSSLPIDMKKLESPKDSTKAVEKKIKQKVKNENDMSNLKIIVESSSPMSTISNSIDERLFTTTASTAKKLNRSRFGVRNFKPRVQAQTVRNQTSSTASSVASTTVKSIPKRVKLSLKSTQVSTTSSEKPIIDSTMNVKSTARYYTPKSRARHQNSSRIKQSTTKSSSLATKVSTVKTNKVRRTTKKPSKK